MTHARAPLLVCAFALASITARADDTGPLWSSPAPQTLLSPDARRFLAPSLFAYWAGTERVIDGELSIATPRASEGAGFLPALDDHLGTTTYARGATAVVRGGSDANVFELSSLHDIRGGAVVGVSFRFDARDQSAAQGNVVVVLPLPSRLWLVPTVAVGASTYFAPEVLAGVELRSDRSKPVGCSIGAEASGWTEGRARVLGSAAFVARLSRVAAIEERVALGAWAGGDVAGQLAMRWVSAALQNIGPRAALYERVTLARGLTPETGSARDESATYSVDVAAGFRHALGSRYGFAVQLDEGGQQRSYERWGGELTVYGVLF